MLTINIFFYAGKIAQGKHFLKCWDIRKRRQIFDKKFSMLRAFRDHDSFIAKENGIAGFYHFRKGRLKKAQNQPVLDNPYNFASHYKSQQVIYGPGKRHIWLQNLATNAPAKKIDLSDHTQRITALNFIDEKRITVANGEGRAFIYDLGKQEVVWGKRIYDPIEEIHYDPSSQFHLLRSQFGLYLMPHLSDFSGDIPNILPLPIFDGHSMQDIAIDAKFDTIAVLKHSGEILIFYLQGKK